MVVGYRCRHCGSHYSHGQGVSDGQKLPGNGEGHHDEEVHSHEEEEGEHAQEEEHPQDEVPHREQGEEKVHHREEEVVMVVVEVEVDADPREHRRPDSDDVSSLPEWHHLAGQP